MLDQRFHNLKEIVTQEGLGVVRDPDRFAKVLRDAGWKQEREIFLLSTALRAGVVARLLSVASDEQMDRIITRIAQKLQNDFAIQEEAARWSVEAWAFALGLSIVSSESNTGSLEKQTEKQNYPKGLEELVRLVFSSIGNNDRKDTPQLECPNCRLPLVRPADCQGVSWRVCPGCGWAFSINENAEIVDIGAVPTVCPNTQCCHAFVITAGGPIIECPQCGTGFLVDGQGNVVGTQFCCPSCGTWSHSRIGGAQVVCQECGWHFTFNDEGDVVAGFAIRCPECEHDFRLGCPGPADCPSCQLPFTVDNQGVIVEQYAECPCCRQEAYCHIGGGRARCGACEHNFSIDASGRIVGGFVVECPLCFFDEVLERAGAFICDRCGFASTVDGYGEVVAHPPLEECPHCEMPYRVSQGAERCPRCGKQFHEEGE